MGGRGGTGGGGGSGREEEGGGVCVCGWVDRVMRAAGLQL